MTWAVDGPPIGVWVTANGTFDVMMQDQLTLLPDGTGRLDSWSVLHGHEVHALLWRHVATGLLQIDLRFDDDEADRPPEWENIRYEAGVVELDAGGPVRVLANVDESRFWTLVGPIELRSQPAQPPGVTSQPDGGRP